MKFAVRPRFLARWQYDLCTIRTIKNSAEDRDQRI